MTWAVVVFTCGLAVVAWLVGSLLRNRGVPWRVPPGARLPPMPPRTSVWGHVELLRSDFHRKAALEWSNVYGPVFRLKLNFCNIVILNSIDVIKTYLNTKELLNRSQCFLTARDYYTGVGSLNGVAWIAHRKFCSNTLSHVGFGKTAMENGIMEEARRLSEKIANTNGEPTQVGKYVMSSIVNNVASFFYGPWPPDHPTRIELHRIMMQLGNVLATGHMYQFTPPLLRRLQFHLHFTRNSRVNACMVELEEFSKKQIEFHLNSNKDGIPDFIHDYMKKIKHDKREPDDPFKYRHLVGTVNGFLIGGTFTSTSSIQMHLVNFACSPHNIQAKVHKEIDEVIGHDRRPTWEDRKRMPFTMACMWELQRWNTASVLGAARECSEDVVIGDFFIPKGTVVLANIWSVHHDPALWNEPQKFMPSRFLNEDGSILSHKPEFLIPFSTGRRSCPGETFASLEIFLMVTYLLQKFHVFLGNPMDFDLDSNDVPAEKAQQIKLRFVPRHHAKT